MYIADAAAPPGGQLEYLAAVRLQDGFNYNIERDYQTGARTDNG